MPDSLLHKEEEASMPETLSQNDTTLPLKRKSQIEEKEQTNQPTKAQKLEALNDNGNEEKSTVEPSRNSTVANSSVTEDGSQKDVVSEDEEDEDVDYENDDDDDDVEDDEEESPVVDRKGKGIMIESEEDGDDDDDDDESDDDDELEDDPLAEVDLDNILPSRTRRKAVNPGVFIGKDKGKIDGDDDDSDSDD